MVTFELLSFEALLAIFGENTISESDPGALSWRTVLGVDGVLLWGTSNEPVLLPKRINNKYKHTCNKEYGGFKPGTSNTLDNNQRAYNQATCGVVQIN